MKADLLHLYEWIARLGVRRLGWAPEFNETVQPVQVVGDVSSLVRPLLPAVALAGGVFTSNVARQFAGQFSSRSPGGSFIRGFRFGTNVAALNFEFRVSPTPWTFVGSAVCTNYNMGPDPAVGVVTIGDIAAIGAIVTDPQFTMAPANSTHSLDDLWFIPPGSFFLWRTNFTGVTEGRVLMTWTEVP